MKRPLWTLGLLLCLAALPALADAPKSDALKAGAELYENNCVQCHGDEGHGDGPQARFLQPKPADLTAPKLKHGEGDDDLYLSISKGVTGTAMNGFDHVLKPDEMKALVAYVQSLRKPAPSASH